MDTDYTSIWVFTKIGETFNYHYFCFKTQTEDDSDKFSGFADDNSGYLAEFLRRVEPAMHKQLEMNVKSHAFDGMVFIIINYALKFFTCYTIIYDAFNWFHELFS